MIALMVIESVLALDDIAFAFYEQDLVAVSFV
jgi:hypothetical protein